MTANQLQNASNIETERHNRAMEALDQRRLDLTEEHNNNMDNLDYLYKTKTLELQKAQGDEKLRLQGDLNEIERDKQLELQRWHALTTALQEEEIGIKQQAQNWLEEYQGHMINLGYGKQFIDEWGTYLKGLEIDYQNQRRLDEIEIARERNEIELEKNTIGWANWTLASDRFQSDRYLATEDLRRKFIELGLEKSRTEMDNATSFANSIFQGVKTIGSVLIPFAFAPIQLPNVNLGRRKNNE